MCVCVYLVFAVFVFTAFFVVVGCRSFIGILSDEYLVFLVGVSSPFPPLLVSVFLVFCFFFRIWKVSFRFFLNFFFSFFGF